MFRFAEIEQVYWLLAVALAALAVVYGYYQKNKLLKKIGGLDSNQKSKSLPALPFDWLRIGLIFATMLFLVLSLMRPQGDPQVTQVQKRGRDLVFVIDVSKSMLAEDLRPNRLERAKQMVADVVDDLEGDRVGLLIFAGTTRIKSPLTLDYHYFKNILDRIGPDDLTQGGSHIGAAIRLVSERLFYDQDNSFRDVILITDGEDQESRPIEAAQDAATKGIRIHTVGLGDPKGSNIPIRNEDSYRLLKYNERVVTTRLDEATLKKISEITQGVYVPVRTDLADLAGLYRDYISTAAKKEEETKQSEVWSELYQFFLGIAIFLLVIETLLAYGRSANKIQDFVPRSQKR